MPLAVAETIVFVASSAEVTEVKTSFAKATEVKAGCGAVGSVLRSGRRGRKFESSHPDQKRFIYS